MRGRMRRKPIAALAIPEIAEGRQRCLSLSAGSLIAIVQRFEKRLSWHGMVWSTARPGAQSTNCDARVNIKFRIVSAIGL